MKKPKRKNRKSGASVRSSKLVLRLCPKCKDLTAEPVGSIDQHEPNGKGGWSTVTIMQMWNCSKCKHDFADWKPHNDQAERPPAKKL